MGYDYLTCMPGSTFRGIHESIINYGGNSKPEMLSCVHEEISAAMAHGYAKMAGKPMAIIVHNTVGLQHASMAIYNAYADRVPMLILVGNIADSATRRPGVEWYHTATDVAAIVRGFIKYDAQPISLQSFGEESQKAHSMAMTRADGTDARHRRRRSRRDADGQTADAAAEVHAGAAIRRRSGRPRRRC